MGMLGLDFYCTPLVWEEQGAIPLKNREYPIHDRTRVVVRRPHALLLINRQRDIDRSRGATG